MRRRIFTKVAGAAGLALVGFGLTSCASKQRSPAAELADGRLVLTDTADQKHDVRAILNDGKSVALVFWQTWCLACHKKAPALIEATKTRQDVRFFGVVSGSDEIVKREELLQTTQKLGLPFPQTRDRDGTVAARFGVVSTPTIIVLGPDGQTTHRGSDLPETWK